MTCNLISSTQTLAIKILLYDYGTEKHYCQIFWQRCKLVENTVTNHAAWAVRWRSERASALAAEQRHQLSLTPTSAEPDDSHTHQQLIHTHWFTYVHYCCCY